MKKALLVSLDSDLGKHMKVVLEEEGYQVVATSRNNLPGTVHFELTDLANATSFAPEEFDLLVYNLGVSQVNRTRVETLRLNAILACDALEMLASSVKHGGRIVAFSSGWGSLKQVVHSGESNEITYRMSKAALNIGVAVLANRFHTRHWICMQPGFITTKMNTNLSKLPSEDPYKAMKGVLKHSLAATDRYCFIDYMGRKL